MGAPDSAGLSVRFVVLDLDEAVFVTLSARVDGTAAGLAFGCGGIRPCGVPLLGGQPGVTASAAARHGAVVVLMLGASSGGVRKLAPVRYGTPPY